MLILQIKRQPGISCSTSPGLNLCSLPGTEGACTDTPRQSVLESEAYKTAVGDAEGYLEAFNTLKDTASIYFTAQPYFTETTTEWAKTLQAGNDGQIQFCGRSNESAERYYGCDCGRPGSRIKNLQERNIQRLSDARRANLPSVHFLLILSLKKWEWQKICL